MSNKIQNNKAFTLIELMVATTLFTIIMMMGVGALVISSNSAKASQKLRIAVDNVNFAMESMTRELRMGTHYYCLKSGAAPMGGNPILDCDNGNVIIFTPQKVGGVQTIARVAYKISPRGNGTSSLQRCDPTCLDVVSGDVDINELKFYVKGSYLPSPNPLPNDNIQPSVEILIKGIVTVKNKNISKSFTLQTMTSQRSAEK